MKRHLIATKEIHFEDLPKSWTITELGELLERITNGLNIKQNREPKGIPVTRIETISKGEFDFERVQYVHDIEDEKKDKYLLKQGDILFSHINSDLHLGKTAIFSSNRQILHGVNLLLLRTKQDLLFPKYLHYLLNYYRRIGVFIAIAQHAVNQSSLNQAKIKSLRIPLTSINEQKSIVAEIEKQFSRLDGAISNLKRVKANLKRYKTAVLKAAVEGKLTEEWRKANPDVEPASELLKRILAERKKKWEVEHPGKKYKEPTPPDTSNLPELLKGWVWATIEQLATKVQYGSSAKTNEHSSGVPVLRMGNIFEGQLKLDDLKYLPKNHPEFPDLLLEKGDLLFNRTNSPELVGKTTVYMGKPKPCSFASYLIRVKMADGIRSNFVSFYINSVYGRKWIKTVVSQQVGQANVNGTKLQALLIPLPPDTEQQKIIEEVESRFSVTEEIEAAIETNLKRADRLCHSILKKAFSGKLI